METSRVALRDLPPRTLAQWQRLAATAVEPNPFAEPEAVLPAARLLPGGEASQLLCVHDRDELVFALPVHRRVSYHGVPLRSLGTWRHDYLFLGTPLVAPGVEEQAWCSVLNHLETTAPGPLAMLELLPMEGPVAEGLSHALGGRLARWLVREHRPMVRRRPLPTYTEGRLSSRRRKQLARLRRRLAEQLAAEVALVEHGRTRSVPSAVETFLRVEASGWKGRAGTAMARRPRDAAYFRELCRGYADVGRLELWTLGSAQQAVAAQVNLRSADTVFHMKIAYDEAYAQYSPGVQLDLEMLDVFHRDATLRLLDSCTVGADNTSGLLYPDSRSLGTLLIPTARGLGPAAVRSLPLLRQGFLGARTRLRGLRRPAG